MCASLQLKLDFEGTLGLSVIDHPLGLNIGSADGRAPEECQPDAA